MSTMNDMFGKEKVGVNDVISYLTTNFDVTADLLKYFPVISIVDEIYDVKVNQAFLNRTLSYNSGKIYTLQKNCLTEIVIPYIKHLNNGILKGIIEPDSDKEFEDAIFFQLDKSVNQKIIRSRNWGNGKNKKENALKKGLSKFITVSTVNDVIEKFATPEIIGFNMWNVNIGEFDVSKDVFLSKFINTLAFEKPYYAFYFLVLILFFPHPYKSPQTKRDLTCEDYTEPLISQMAKLFSEEYKPTVKMLSEEMKKSTHHNFIPSQVLSAGEELEPIDTMKSDRQIIDAIRETAIELQKQAYDNCRLLPYSSVEKERMDLPTLNVETTVSSTDSGEISLINAIKNSYSNIMITGSGGCGKTYSLLYCADKFLSEKEKIIPLYIPLNIFNVSNFSGIEDYLIDKIKAKYDNDFSKTSRSYYKFLSEYPKNGVKIIFLCDGFNEVISKEAQGKIIHNIRELQHKGIYRFVITSRYDLSNTFAEYSGNISNTGFSSYMVNDLKDDKVIIYVRDFLEKHGIDSIKADEIIKRELCVSRTKSADKSERIKEIYKTPMAIVMFCGLHNTSILSDVNGAGFYSPINRLGELLHNFILCIKNGNKSVRIKKDERFLQYLGYRMNIDGVFTIPKAVFCKYFLEFAEKFGINDLKADDMWESSFVNDVMMKVNSSINEISFNHQNFRDYFAAAFLREFIISIDCANIKEFIGIDKKIPNETSILLAELLGEYKVLNLHVQDRADTSIQKLLYDNSNNLEPSAVAYLIELVKIGRENDLSRFDFKGLDLSLTKLNGVILSAGPGANRIKASFENSTITKDTLAPVGHAGAALVMFYVEERYILSFSKNTICSFDMKTGVQSVVAEYSEEVILSGILLDGTNRIVTGDTVGVLSLWEYAVIDGSMTVSLVKQYDLLKSIYMYASKARRCRVRIQSICNYLNDQIMFSLSCGDVFAVDSELSTTPVLKVSLCSEDDKYSRYSCVKSQGEDFYISYGDKIYKKGLDNFVEMPKSIKGCIYDFILMNNEDCLSIIINFRGDKNNKDGTRSAIYKFNELMFEKKGEKSVTEIITEQHSTSSQGFTGWNKFSTPSDSSLSVYLCANTNDDLVTPGVYKLTFEPLYDEDGELIDIKANEKGSSYEPIFGNKHIMSVECVLPFIYDGKEYIATSSTDRSIEIMDVSSTNNMLLYQLPGHTDGVTCMKVIDDDTIYTSHYSGEVCKWHKKKDWKCTVMAKPHSNWVWAVDVLHRESDDKRYIVGASYDHNISLTDDKTGEYRILRGCKGNIKALAVIGENIVASYDYKDAENTVYEMGIFYNIFDEENYKFTCVKSFGNGFVRSMCKNGKKDSISFCVNSMLRSEVYDVRNKEIEERIMRRKSIKRTPQHIIESSDHDDNKIQMRSVDCINYNDKNIYACAGNAGKSYAEVWIEGESVANDKACIEIDNGVSSENDGFSTVKLINYDEKLFIIIGSYDHHIYVYEICLAINSEKISDIKEIAYIEMSDKVMNVQYHNEHLYVSLFNGKVVSWHINEIVESQCEFIVEASSQLLFQSKTGLHIMGVDFTNCNSKKSIIPEDFKRILRYYGKI